MTELLGYPTPLSIAVSTQTIKPSKPCNHLFLLAKHRHSRKPRCLIREAWRSDHLSDLPRNIKVLAWCQKKKGKVGGRKTIIALFLKIWRLLVRQVSASKYPSERDDPGMKLQQRPLGGSVLGRQNGETTIIVEVEDISLRFEDFPILNYQRLRF